ncbi:MAG: 2Fe-2S iron-sulfur cluster binding domain-containing protein [Rubrivivax sp.]|nr:MAG: 2Fe-2S iron-sulfur cluster binding domain-containing protein [Rubrivivax sp.]
MPVDDTPAASAHPLTDGLTVRVLPSLALPSGASFPADALGTVWHAAREAGLRLPTSCRNGTCRTCLSRLVDGTVAYHIDWPGVSREERAEGWFLPCVAYPESDLVIEAAVQPDNHPTAGR